MFFGIPLYCSLSVAAFYLVARYFLFEKAGLSGWKSLVPIWNRYLICRISGTEKLFGADVILALLTALYVFFICSETSIAPEGVMASWVIPGWLFWTVLLVTVALRFVINGKLAACFTTQRPLIFFTALGSLPYCWVLKVFTVGLLAFGEDFSYQAPERASL